GHVVLDIGAHIGAHTVPLAQLAGPGGRVLAFEPQRLLYYCLCANVVINNLNNTVCYQVAVGESKRTANVPEIDYATESNFGGLDLSRDYASMGSYAVPVRPLDEF